MEKMKITTYEQLKRLHGKKVTCQFTSNDLIEDGKISVRRDGYIFVCQNKKNGLECVDKLGYRYSWLIATRGDTDVSFFCIETTEDVNLKYSMRDLQENKIAVHVKTKKDFESLRKICVDNHERFFDGKDFNFFNCDFPGEVCVGFWQTIGWCDKNHYERAGWTIIKVSEIDTKIIMRF